MLGSGKGGQGAGGQGAGGRGRGEGAVAGRRAGMGKGKNELVSDTTSFLLGAAAGRGWGGVGGRVGIGKNELVSDTNSFLPGEGGTAAILAQGTRCV